MILNPEVFTEVFEECVVKLSSIIENQHPGHSKPAYDIFPDKVLNILLSDICQGFYFYPLHEIINANHQKLHLSCTEWKRTEDV